MAEDNNNDNGSNIYHMEHVVWASMILITMLFFASFGLVAVLMWFLPDKVFTEVVEPLVRGRIVSRALALFLIVPTIGALTLFDKIKGEAAIAALSAIAGYVLASAATETVIAGH